ncbi:MULTISPECIES: response regulator transcription factor [Auritidibacter]|uniref:response regulator transcription factor n=1 Tax=Auritidibacter TaxID=1160973 RepID=UPI000D7313DE|nr:MULTISPECIES: LuxR C-terminal-related transcriptional regulator [Auritidibacter]PXA76673.1 hypothetical protein DCC24_06435 [Auritidibacter sp. NML100628]WHS34044.1 LuxR C-terminal-related transcriptional regulator [Auritidibacter ignavus]
MITLSTICGTGEAKSVSNVESLLKDFDISHNRVVGVAKLPEGANILLIGEPSLQQVIHELGWHSDVDSLTILLATPDPHEVTALGPVRVVSVGTPLDTAEIISAAVSLSLPGEYVSRHQVARKLSHHILESPLTAREKEVLHQVSLGKRDDQIAQTLSVSTATVHTHIKNLRSRLQARSRTHAVTMGHNLGILPLTLPDPSPL